jgi:F-type H+-transporting ATPase subunit c
MGKLSMFLVVLGIVIAGTCGLSLAEEAPKTQTAAEIEEGPEHTTRIEETGKTAGVGLAIGGACFGAGVAAVGGGLAVSRIGGNCIEAMARQPEAAGAMFTPMIVTAAMVEGGMLFAMVICLMAILQIMG